MSLYHCIEIECSCCSVYDDVSTARNIDKFKFVLMLSESHRLQFNCGIVTYSRKLKLGQ
jgi:hypothetical protein